MSGSDTSTARTLRRMHRFDACCGGCMSAASELQSG